MAGTLSAGRTQPSPPRHDPACRRLAKVCRRRDAMGGPAHRRRRPGWPRLMGRGIRTPTMGRWAFVRRSAEIDPPVLVDQIAPRPVREVPVTALTTTTTMIAPIVATTIE